MTIELARDRLEITDGHRGDVTDDRICAITAAMPSGTSRGIGRNGVMIWRGACVVIMISV